MLGAEAFAAEWAAGQRLSADGLVALVTRGRGRRGRPASGWPSLTPTEQTVVDLVCEGLSNKEIAVRLLVSRRTVDTHLTHVYAKLGVGSRTELVSLALRRSLTRT
jgi:DNA-binding CsgD family transcriptional regulator